MTAPTQVHCTHERHALAILDIFNEAILNSTALYDYKPRAPESMGPWFEAKTKGNFPVIGIEDPDGTLLAFGSYGSFRAWPAYKYTVEHSVYVAPEYIVKGIGSVLLTELIKLAKSEGYHTMIGAIDAENQDSIKFHEKFGFNQVGLIKQAAFKFDRWLDLAFMQLML